MKKWMEAMAHVDDEYLIGLSNKGIVKRAYKDMAELTPELMETDEEVRVRVGEEICTIGSPLGDSRCSCASRSVCKHLVMAILRLKEVWETERKSTPGNSAVDDLIPSFPEIDTYPLEQLKKSLGGRRYQSLLNCVKSNIKPDIQVTSVITVTFPETDMIVTLLEPLKHSACSCHKKDLCEHKAAAVIWYQLSKQILNEEMLAVFRDERQDIHIEEVRSLAIRIKNLLEDGLRTGLARTSPDMMDSLERMALLCHNGKLANFERYLRALGDSYRLYFKRAASFRTEHLMMQTMRLYQRTEALLTTDRVDRAAGLAGEFKSEYLPAGELRLIGIGARHFKSQSGYEGETYYFLEEQSKIWYVYTYARPVYYESSTRQTRAMGNQVPWGLSVRADELTEYRFLLKHAKVNNRNSISSGSETHGEVTGSRSLNRSEIEGCYYTDFRTLFQERFESVREDWLSGEEVNADEVQSRSNSRLVFVQAQTAGEAVFDNINQIFSLMLYDAVGCRLAVEVVYSKEESLTIHYLERIARKMGNGIREIPCFMGEVYLNGGMMKLYPVACLNQEEILDDRCG